MKTQQDRPEDHLSRVARSCLFTKGVTAKHTAAQAIGEPYSIPDEAARLLAAKLIFEEALETIEALGFTVHASPHGSDMAIDIKDADFRKADWDPSLEKIIDGSCDTIYVATGALMACGVPDLPHLHHVCYANEQKFPGGRALYNPETGKYLKPSGWVGPKHEAIMPYLLTHGPNLKLLSEQYVQEGGVPSGTS